MFFSCGMVSDTFVLYIPHAWRGIFQRDNFLRSCEVSLCSGCDRQTLLSERLSFVYNVSD